MQSCKWDDSIEKHVGNQIPQRLLENRTKMVDQTELPPQLPPYQQRDKSHLPQCQISYQVQRLDFNYSGASLSVILINMTTNYYDVF